MNIMMLSALNLDKLVEFEKKARISEAEIFLEDFDEAKFAHETLNALESPHFASARCLMCADENGNVLGRLDFSMLSSLAFGGDLRAYVDWVYVLKEHRHKGVAQFLFKKMEAYLTAHDTNEYFLIAAENDEAQNFYRSLESANIEKQNILTKKISHEWR